MTFSQIIENRVDAGAFGIMAMYTLPPRVQRAKARICAEAQRPLRELRMPLE
jgi:hypothetical protein